MAPSYSTQPSVSADTKAFTIHIMFHAVKLLNFFPTKGGISDTLSPKTIMSGETLDYKKHLRLQIGQYCQVHEEDTLRNSLRPRTKGAISLGPSGNLQGGFKFMALNTGKKIIQRSWDVIPMPDTVITRVNTLGNDQPEQLIFTDRHGRLIGVTDNADIPGVDFDEDDDAEIPGVDIVELPGVDVTVEHMEEDPAPQIVEIDDLDIPAPDPPPVEVETMEQAQVPAAPVEPAPVAQQRRPRGHLYSPESGHKQRHTHQACPAQIFLCTDAAGEPASAQSRCPHVCSRGLYQAEPDVVAAIMTQLSHKSGLKEWGNKAYTAAESEMKQLHFHNTFKPMHWSKLTDIQCQTVLESHMFLKEK